MRRKDDPIYYKMKVEEWLDKARENGISVVLRKRSYGDFLVFMDMGTEICIKLSEYSRLEAQHETKD